MSLLDCKGDFFDFGEWTYLNAAYHGPLPRVAAAALQEAMEVRKNPALLTDVAHFEVPDAYRRAVAPLLGADPQDIAVTDSTSHGILILVRGLDWSPGDEVITPEGEFPANRLPWLSLEERGVRLRQIELGDGTDAAARVEAALSPRTRVVSVSWVSFMDGRRLDLAPLSELCRDRGVLFAVDASQGLGGLPFDLAGTPADLVACSGYKWLLGPYGVGLAYVAPELGARLGATNVNWFAATGAENFGRLATLPHEFELRAMRFDVHETASFFNLAPATAAAEYLGEITPRAVEAHVRALQDRFLAGLPPGYASRPSENPLRSNILCIQGEDPQATEAAFARIREAKIALSAREGSIRLSPHVYNTPADVDRLLEVLAG